MKMELLKGDFVICKLDVEDIIPTWIDTRSFSSITRTDEELSIVCLDNNIPDYVECVRDRKILKIQGPLDFSLVGIIAKVSKILAENNISIFTISTFNTDYILIENEKLDEAIQVLQNSQIQII